jgi:hypothetical protein
MEESFTLHWYGILLIIFIDDFEGKRPSMQNSKRGERS